MSGKRAVERDVFFYDIKNRDTQLGGLVLLPAPFSLYDDYGQVIARDATALLPGKYFIASNGTIMINDEPILTRTTSVQTGSRVQCFTGQVRERDGGCVISKRPVQSSVFWTGFEAAHIFPLAYQQHWDQYDYGRHVSTPSPRGGAINSVQNGLLLSATIHHYFDNYLVSINPDDGYKIVCFQQVDEGFAGTSLDPRILDHPHHPSEALLRWHFRQAVLSNMRGAGEPIFETDFPSGSDIMEDIMNGPKAAERMEFELFERLAHCVDSSRTHDTSTDEEHDPYQKQEDVSDKG